MRTYLECVPCFVRQVLEASRLSGRDDGARERVLRETLRMTAEMSFDRPPAWMGGEIHRLLREAIGDPDPYRQAKRDSNAMARNLYPELAQRVLESDDAFETALRLAIAGNVIDFGLGHSVTEEQVRQAIEDALTDRVDHGAIVALRQAIDGAEDILYLADNAGEIVLDRLLIERMPLDRVTLVVRGGPVINDATMEDAETAGLASIVRVMDNGADLPGTMLETCSSEFRERFWSADLVVAKGQGNYETLSNSEREVFFLFKAKCPVVARDIGCELGQINVYRHGGSGKECTDGAGRAASWRDDRDGSGRISRR
ncbi:MAG: DUF89 family protein [Phycisphaerae bacterium]|nr:DUF89 family protein [Phycisphaerae bacterium]